MNRKQIAAKIKATNGKLFQVTFVKKDGSTRKMVARLGVNKTSGAGLNYDPIAKGLVTVYEFVVGKSIGQYRCFKIDRLVSAKIKGKTYVA